MADVHAQMGPHTQGIEELDSGLANTAKIGDRFREAELHRLKGEFFGELLRDQADTENTWPAVEERMTRAPTLAQSQRAKALELRAAISLARLWQGQGKTAEARELLAPVFDWFTEGFDTADLKDAKALLNDLQ